MNDLVIYGAGGFAREVLQVVLDINEERPVWNVLGFLVDPEFRDSDKIQGYPVLGGAEWVSGKEALSVAVANGTPRHRRAMVERLQRYGKPECPVLIHPRSWVGRGVSFGQGCIICANSSLTTDISLADHVTVNVNVAVGHDVRVESFSTVGPGVMLLGNTHVESEVDISAGCVIVPHVKLGRGSVLGAGAVALQDIPPDSLAVGIPAKVVKRLGPA